MTIYENFFWCIYFLIFQCYIWAFDPPISPYIYHQNFRVSSQSGKVYVYWNGVSFYFFSCVNERIELVVRVYIMHAHIRYVYKSISRDTTRCQCGIKNQPLEQNLLKKKKKN